MLTKTTLPLITLHLTILIWAGSTLFPKIINLPAAEIIYLRSVPGFVVLTFLALILRKSFRFSLVDLCFGILIGLLTVAHWITFYQSVQASSVALGMITLFTYPLFTTLVEPLIHRKRVSRQQLLVALFGLLGIALVSVQSLSNGPNISAVGLGLISSLFFTARNLSSKYLASHIPSLMQMWLQLLTALVALGFWFGTEPLQHTSLSNWQMLTLLGVFFVALPHTAYLYVIKRIDASQASLMGMIQPVYAIILAILILNELPTLLEITGGFIILGAASLATIGPLNKPKKPIPKASY